MLATNPSMATSLRDTTFLASQFRSEEADDAVHTIELLDRPLTLVMALVVTPLELLPRNTELDEANEVWPN
jgi:hypothetical protein